MAVWKDATSGNWSDPGRWNGGVPDAIGATASFTQLFALFNEVRIIDLQGTVRIIGTLDMVSSDHERYNILNGGLQMQVASGNAAINVSVTGSGPYLRSVIEADINLASNTIITVTGASTQLNVMGSIFGTGRLTKSGAGELFLEGILNGWSGGTSITAGKLRLEEFSDIGSGPLAISAGATFDLGGQNSSSIGALSGAGNITNSGPSGTDVLVQSNTGTTFFSGVISNGSAAIALTKTGTGTLNLSGANSYSGQTLLQQGTISAGAVNSWSANSAIAVSAGATLDLDGFSQRIGGLSGAGLVTNTTGLTVNLRVTSAANSTFSGIISDGAGVLSLTKAGSGTLTLAGANTYEGQTSITGGTLKGGIANALGSTSALSVSAGATFDIGGFSQSIGVLSGAGVITNTASASRTLTETNDVATTFSGVIQQGSGGLIALVKNGVGTLELSGANTYSGATAVNAGVLKAGATNTFGNLSAITVAAGARLDLNGFNQSIGALSGAGSVTNLDPAAVTLTQTNAAASTFSGVMSDGDSALTFIKGGGGVLTLSGVNIYTGTTTLNAGTLALTGAGSIAASSRLTIGASGVLDISGVGAAASIKTLINSGSVMLGGKTLNLTGQLTNLIGTYVGSAATERLVVTIGAAETGFSLSQAVFNNWTSGIDVIAINGNALGNTLVGSAFADTLNGGGSNDTLAGGADADTLNGGTGADTMRGQQGSDTYRVDDAGDIVDETGGNGIDTVESSITFDLSNTTSVIADVENLTLTGTANINATGNALGNVLTGNSGANIINGGGAADTLDGGIGNDTYIVDASDVVIENANGGTDTIQTSVASYSLVGKPNVENLVGTAATGQTLTGNAVNNSVFGGGGADTINGGTGLDALFGGGGGDTLLGSTEDDRLFGGLNHDILTGGPGNDTFVFHTALSGAANVDHITDFSNVAGHDDIFNLDDAIFTALTAGALAGTAFVSNTTGLAADANTRIIYETDTHWVIYDPDGTGAAGPVLFAIVDPTITLTAADFFVV